MYNNDTIKLNVNKMYCITVSWSKHKNEHYKEVYISGHVATDYSHYSWDKNSLVNIDISSYSSTWDYIKWP